MVETYSKQKVSESVVGKEQNVISNEGKEGKKPLNLLAKKTQEKMRNRARTYGRKDLGRVI